MIDTASQPLIALYFLLGGAIGYAVYEFLYGIKKLFPLKIVEFFADFFSVVSCGAIFLYICKKFNYGRVLPYEFIAFFVGMLPIRLLLKNTLRREFEKILLSMRRKILETAESLNKAREERHNKQRRRKNEKERKRELRRSKENERKRNDGKTRYRRGRNDEKRVERNGMRVSSAKPTNGRKNLRVRGKRRVRRQRGLA